MWCSDRISAASEDDDDLGCEVNVSGDVLALVRDPSLQGDKELFLLYDKEFQDILKRLREDDEK